MNSNPIPNTYLDPNLSVDDRVADLLSKMTLDEKLAQLGSAWVFELLSDMTFDDTKAQNLMSDGIGHITRVAGASSLKPKAGAALTNQIQKYIKDHTRLAIPALVHEECCAGYMARNATCFPQIIGLASTWEPDLTHKMAQVVRRQMKAAGAHQGLSPLLDVVRDPRWGRVEETFGEDPYLVALNGLEFVKGLQGDNWRNGVIATAKHFVGYGVPDGGFNWNPAHIPARELREVFLYPFEVAVREGKLQSLMNGYNELDGIPCAANEELLDTILRQEWGFDGTVVSDYFAVDQLEIAHHVTNNKADSAMMALAAGIDIELPNTDCYGQPLKEAIQSGTFDIAYVDQSVRRLLRQKFGMGLFENPFVDAEAIELDTPAERQLAREIAQKSIILLKNENKLLPLQKACQSIAIIGPQAKSTRNMVGDYAYIAHIESLMDAREKSLGGTMPIPEEMTVDSASVAMNTILETISATVSADTVVNYAFGCDVLGEDRSGFDTAVQAAQKSEIAVLFLGGKSGLTDDCTCGEFRDRADLGLTGVQQELLEAIHATGTPTILVLINGRPLAINWAAENIPAIVEAWLPGEEGAEAITDVLFGDFNPGGKLPITVPRHVGQIPTYYNHKPSGGRSHFRETYVNLSNKPLWPFGFGLSYTTFEISNLRLADSEIPCHGTTTLTADITNTGPVIGDEVVQLYGQDPVSTVTRPIKELIGFIRVNLAPSETKTIQFTVEASQFAFYDRKMNFVVEPGEIRLMVGTSSDHIQGSAALTLIGDRPVLAKPKSVGQTPILQNKN